MLHLLDESLEAFLRAAVPLPERDVDVSFDAPDREWGSRVNRPTVNAYLWDLRRNADEQDGGMELRETPDGRPVWMPPPPRMDCRYLVTAWTSEVRDEHALLGAVLQALLLAPRLEPEYLRGAYAAVRPLPSLRVAVPERGNNPDLWSALGGQLKPGLDLIVTATVDAMLSWPAGPLTERYEFTVRSTGSPATGGEETISLLGGDAGAVEPGSIVTTGQAAAEVRPDGRYVVQDGAGAPVVAPPPGAGTGDQGRNGSGPGGRGRKGRAGKGSS